MKIAFELFINVNISLPGPYRPIWQYDSSSDLSTWAISQINCKLSASQGFDIAISLSVSSECVLMSFDVNLHKKFEVLISLRLHPF